MWVQTVPTSMASTIQRGYSHSCALLALIYLMYMA